VAGVEQRKARFAKAVLENSSDSTVAVDIVTRCNVSAEVRRHRSGTDFERQHSQLVRDPPFDRQPVQVVYSSDLVCDRLGS